MFELKRLSDEAIPAALEKALRYRLLDEPAEAESICHDAPNRSGKPTVAGRSAAGTDRPVRKGLYGEYLAGGGSTVPSPRCV